MKDLSRRHFLTMTGGMAALAGLGVSPAALAQGAAAGQLTVAYPADVPTWDPNARSLAAVQSLYKCVYDQPLNQSPDLQTIPWLITEWGYQDGAGLELALKFRDDVTFHDGVPMTAEDFRFTFFDRPKIPVPEGQRRLDTSFLWRKVSDIAVSSPTEAVMKFAEPMPSAVVWLHFLCSFVVPKHYIEAEGLDGFQARPIGTGPYRLVEYQPGSRAVMQAHDGYWGGKPAIETVTVDIVRDATARVAAAEARRAQVAIDLPIRETERLGTVPGLTARVDPVADIVLLQITRNGGFEKDQVRLAAHHAINKEGLNRAFYLGKAVTIDVPAARGTPGYPEGFTFEFSEDKAKALLAEVGYGPDNPVPITFFATNGAFPNDYDMARAIAQMWERVGIKPTLEVVELSTYQERLRAGTLPEATMFQWGNSTGDPEMYAGYLLDPKAIFSAFKSDDLGEMIHPLLVEPDTQKRYEGYRAVNRFAVEKGYSIAIMQGTKTIVHEDRVAYAKWDNGWTLPATWSLT
jgi:peptide/nickel transport system substrate-binding protein